jgi:F0F1-type ATP synthase delta subunit
MKQAYVTALISELESGQAADLVLSRLKELLARKGHTKLWPQILRMTMRVLSAKQAAMTPHVTVAKAGTVTVAELNAALTALGAASAAYTESVDQNLIGGFTVFYKDTLLDASYKRALMDLYRRLTQA